MTDKRGAGKLRNKLHFQRRALVDDGFGNVQAGDWETKFDAYAEFIPLRGGEPVIAARLTGTQPFVVRIRSSAAAREVTTAWRIVDERRPSRVLNITSIADPDNKNDWLDLMATEGVAA